MLEISSLTKRLGKRNVITNLSFSAQRQECIGLFGESGAGKTTLLNVISGLASPRPGMSLSKALIPRLILCKREEPSAINSRTALAIKRCRSKACSISLPPYAASAVLKTQPG